MLIAKGKIDGWLYVKLINYLLIRCDVLTFKLPNFNHLTLSDEAKKYFPQYKLKGDFQEINNKEFFEYKENISNTLEQFEPFYLKEYIDFKYFDTIQGYDAEIKIVKIDESLDFILTAISGLYDWVYPEKPEDLCFFSKGKCFLKSIAHEKTCFIYTDDEWEKKMLRKLGLKFIDYNELYREERPSLSYTLKY